MEVFNVLYKGVEINVTPFCLAFLREEEAHDWIEQACETKNLTIKSSLGWDESGTVDDYRVEDREGNSYYFVIFKQQL